MNEFLPSYFLEKMEKLLPKSEISSFRQAMIKPLRKCIRINTLKGSVKDVLDELDKDGFVLEKMPWYKYGFFIEKEGQKKIGNTFAHFFGKIYVQEASSMLPVIALDPKPNEAILDMAAAPGSKTTQIVMHMQNKGLVVANEPQLQRIKPLQENLERSGSIIHVITRNDGRFFRHMENSFNRVLVDVPCSVEGTFRKDIKARYLWEQKKVLKLAKLQYQLLKAAINTVQPGGVIVYSTCTLSPEENEMVINKALKEFDIKLEKVKFKGLNYDKGLLSYGKIEFDKQIEKCVRIWPHKTDMEGFFLAKIRKK